MALVFLSWHTIGFLLLRFLIQYLKGTIKQMSQFFPSFFTFFLLTIISGRVNESILHDQVVLHIKYLVACSINLLEYSSHTRPVSKTSHMSRSYIKKCDTLVLRLYIMLYQE
jgi:hypothetical protein